jgi:hypothetical protein
MDEHISTSNNINSKHPRAGCPAFEWLAFRTLFVSGYQMVAAILFLASESRTSHFLTSLDRFGMYKIFFMTLINKTVEARPDHLKAGFVSGFQMVKTKWRPFCFYHLKAGPVIFSLV